MIPINLRVVCGIVKDIYPLGAEGIRFTVKTVIPKPKRDGGTFQKSCSHTCVAWGRTAEGLRRDLVPGGWVYLEGEHAKSKARDKDIWYDQMQVEKFIFPDQSPGEEKQSEEPWNEDSIPF